MKQTIKMILMVLIIIIISFTVGYYYNLAGIEDIKRESFESGYSLAYSFYNEEYNRGYIEGKNNEIKHQQFSIKIPIDSEPYIPTRDFLIENGWEIYTLNLTNIGCNNTIIKGEPQC